MTVPPVPDSLLWIVNRRASIRYHNIVRRRVTRPEDGPQDPAEQGCRVTRPEDGPQDPAERAGGKVFRRFLPDRVPRKRDEPAVFITL